MKNLLRNIRENNVLIQVVDGDLKVFADAAAIDPALLHEIRENKTDLLRFLSDADEDDPGNQLRFSIPVAPLAESYPLSSAQRRLWVLSQFEEGNIAYNVSGVYNFEGALDIDALEYALASLLERHESLRTVFRENEQGEVRQFILKTADIGFHIHYTDLCQEADREQVVARQVQHAFVTPFNLAAGPLLRVGLLRVQEARWVFTLVMHHIVSDGWSQAVLINEILLFYRAFAKKAPNPFPPLRIQYKDYAVWQKDQIGNGALNHHKKYWLQQFAGEIPVVQLPGDRSRPAVKTYKGGVVNKKISSRISNGIRNLGQEAGATLFMSLVASVNALLYKYTGQQDIVIGSPTAGRSHLDLENQIGLYISTLALRTSFSSEDSYRDLLEKTKKIVLEAFHHQAYPFDELVDELQLKRDVSRSALVDVMVVLQNIRINNAMEEMQSDELRINVRENEQIAVSKFDLSFYFMESGREIVARIEYNSDLYNRSTVMQLASHLEQLMSAIVKSPSRPLAMLDYLNDQEKQQVLHTFNATSFEYDRHQTPLSLFAEQVKKNPRGLALCVDDKKFTYKQLNEYSNQLATYLKRKYNLQAGDLAAIGLDRSEWLVLSILAILKTGAAYVPIDPAFPEERKDYIMKDSQCKVLIDDKELKLFRKNQKEYKTSNIRHNSSPADLAYVIYTSGSTGKPKGVMIENRSLVSFLQNYQPIFSLNENIVMGATINPVFDISVLELLGTLVQGIPLVLITNTEPGHLLTCIDKELINALQLTPSRLNQLLDTDSDVLQTLKKLKVLLVGGEALSPLNFTLLKELVGTRVINVYGPTETTIWSTALDIHAAESLSIGRPLLNENIFITDDQQNLCGIGVQGEICIGGEGLARGYLNLPELTAKKFIDNPFRTGERMYRTGDMGKWLPDGNIEFTGRKDDQVKIRGYRIELGEIENILHAHPSVESAAVVARTLQNREKEIIAYIVSSGNPDVPALRAYLAHHLPAYMIPGHFVQLDKMPLNASGKTDRKGLPDPQEGNMSTGVAYTAPRDIVESRLVDIWKAVLNKEHIGIKDRFFELGGHSLKATRLASLIHREFDVRIALKELFIKTSPEEQAQLIRQSRKNIYSTISPVAEQASYPLSPSQRRLWVLSQFEEGNVAYNITGVKLFEGELHLDALQYAFEKLLERHESLRTVFRKNEHEEIRQYIKPIDDTGFTIAFRDVRNQEETGQLVAEVFSQPFDLAKGPLVRAAVLRVADAQWVFAYAMHHIISDGWSMGILIDELLLFYNQQLCGAKNTLEPLRIQYKDYAAWLQAQLEGESLQQHRDFWLRHFEGELPVLELPAGKIRPAIKTYNGASLHRHISAPLATGIKKLCMQEDCTLFMGLLAVANTLFYRYTGQEDIIIGTPVAGRDHTDLENQIGFYVNTLALRTRFKKENSFQELLRSTRQMALEAYEHQHYPFDKLVSDLNLQRDMSRHPLFDVQVIVQDADTAATGNKQSLGATQVKKYEGRQQEYSVFDLVFNFIETGNGLQVRIVYNSDVFTPKAVEQLARHMEQMMASIIDNPVMPIGGLDYLSREEKEQLLVQFNKADFLPDTTSTAVDLFKAQAEKWPTNTAVVFGDTSLTYQQLDEQSDRLAAHMATKYAFEPGQRVGVMLERSDKLIISILAIMKAGYVYVPVDPEFPKSRKEFIVRDTGMQLLITQTHYILDLDYYEHAIFAIDIQQSLLEKAPAGLINLSNTSQLAYIIYTSGSTGEPKGVMIDHHALSVSLQSQKTIFGISPGQKSLQFCAASFDVSVFEIFINLASGATLYVINETDKKDPALIARFITAHQLEVVTMPAAYVRLVKVEQLTGVKKLISGGEPADPGKVKAFSAVGTYYNAYGPTESSLCTSIFAVPADYAFTNGMIPIGKPIPAIQCFITDSMGALVPPGVTGELLIGGAGLAQGYFNNPSLTKEKFTDHPFAANETIYKTGDMARWLPDGNIEFIGRKDEQVKINGYRVEPAEIDRILKQKEGIEEAVVIARRNPKGIRELVAYFVSREMPELSDLRTHIAHHLPSYMVPSHYVRMEALPLTVNGKIDRKKLPAPEDLAPEANTNYVAPRNEAEEKMAFIWQAVLGRQSVGITDGFFEMGGDSIKILQMTAEAKKALQLDIPVADVYKHDTIKSLLEHLSQNKNEIATITRQRSEAEANVLQEIEALKSRVLATMPHTANIEDIYPMSDIEKGMLYESMANDQVAVYHDQMIDRRFFYRFDIARFRRAVSLMVEKHAILRTSFNLEDFEVPVQIVHKTVPVEVPYEDLAHCSRQEKEQLVRAFLKQEREHRFNFAEPALWRISVFNFGADEIVFVFQTHHAIIDGWSDASFKTELNNIYVLLEKDAAYGPAPLHCSYHDFVVQQEVSRRDEDTRNFWKQDLAGYTRTALFTAENDTQAYTDYLDEASLKKLEALATKLNSTVRAISFSAYLCMLKGMCENSEIVAGLVTNNRPDLQDGDKILGCFLNTIPFRLSMDEHETCAGFVRRVHEKLLQLKKYERLSMFEISRLHGRSLQSGNPFFDMIFNFVNFHTYESVLNNASTGGDTAKPSFNIGGFGRTNTFFDFTIDITGGRYRMSLGLTKKLQSGLTAQRVGELYWQLLKHIIDNADGYLWEATLVNDQEQDLLRRWNDTTVDYPSNSGISTLFEEQVMLRPEAIALVYEDQQLSYRSLNGQANRLSNYLRAHCAIEKGDRVAIQLERSEWLIITVLAVLKAGAAYVPLDMGLPAERAAYMMQDAACKLLIDAGWMERYARQEEAQDTGNPGIAIAGHDMAYIMYTSGTSGKPKGAMIAQRSVLRLVKSPNYVTLDEKQVLLATGAFSFDATTFEYWGMLLNGGKLVMSNRETLLDESMLTDLIRKERVTMMWCTAGWLNQLIDKSIGLFEGVTTILAGGDKLSPAHISLLRDRYPALTIINGYGPTENTTFSLCYNIGSVPPSIPIGKPISNSRVYITGFRQQLCLPGVAGEISLAGDGLAQGYLDSPALTAEKFVANPFEKDGRLYRTGDVGRWLPDGNIEFIGRKDTQVKIRGFRVEPGEIENILQSHPQVHASVVVAANMAGAEKELLAYIAGEENVPTHELKDFLEKTLPSYMVPAHFIQLREFPLTLNGKIDKSKLPAPATVDAENNSDYVAPANETEQRLVAVWQELLGREKIGIKDNFFDLGGHSLKIMRLSSWINKEFDTRIRIPDLFARPTIEDMAKEILRQRWLKQQNGQHEENATANHFIL